jgi:asparagine synthase (glutamine-hydrolysing)
MLRDLGYDNVVNFTYGAGETPESRVSRDVASAVDQEWIFVPYDASRIRRAWAQEGAAFVEYAYAGASLPHIQDWYALRHLRANDLIAPDAVFLPGHTVVGNMHDDDVLDRPGDVPAADVRDLIIRHHGVLQPKGPAALHRVPGFTARIDQYLQDCGYDGSPLARLVAIEGWNLHERQTKYINNSMRAYEHFGYDWALPMLEEPVVRAWERFSTRVRRDRTWYAGLVDRRYARATRSQLSTYSPTSLSGGTRARLKSLLRAAGLLTLAERTAAARSYSHHAMAFQAFIDEGSESDLRRIIMKGGNPLGTYADRFLEDAWAPGQRVFG